MIQRSAIISACGTWRYELRRKWSIYYPPMLAIMLNPSTADHRRDDATITRVWKRAASLGCGELIVGNLGAGRATEPEAWKVMPDPVGPENVLTLRRLLREVYRREGIVLVGWGNHGSFKQLDQQFVRLARRAGCKLLCLGHTKTGQPKHPLYIADSQKLELFNG